MVNFFYLVKILLRLPDDAKEMIWSHRNYLYQIPKALPVVLASLSSWSFFNLSNVRALLNEWAPLPPTIALELLFPQYVYDNKF